MKHVSPIDLREYHRVVARLGAGLSLCTLQRRPRGVCVHARLVHLRRRVYFRAIVQQQPHDLNVAVVRRGDTGGPPVLPDQKERRVAGVDGARR
jgi:hypothetical protein